MDNRSVSRCIAIRSPSLLTSGDYREHALDDHGRRVRPILHSVYRNSGQRQNGVPFSHTFQHYPANDLSFWP